MLDEKYKQAIADIDNPAYTIRHGAFYTFLKECVTNEVHKLPDYLTDYFSKYSDARRQIIERIPALLTNYYFCVKYPLASMQIHSIFELNPGIHRFTKHICERPHFATWIKLVELAIVQSNDYKQVELDVGSCPYSPGKAPETRIAEILNENGYILIDSSLANTAFRVVGLESFGANAFSGQLRKLLDAEFPQLTYVDMQYHQQPPVMEIDVTKDIDDNMAMGNFSIIQSAFDYAKGIIARGGYVAFLKKYVNSVPLPVRYVFHQKDLEEIYSKICVRMNR